MECVSNAICSNNSCDLSVTPTNDFIQNGPLDAIVLLENGWVKDAVKYAYSKGKLIIAAGGTSTSFTNGYGVILFCRKHMGVIYLMLGLREYL